MRALRQGSTVLQKRGGFYVPEGLEERDFLRFKSVAAAHVAMYIKHFEGLGWKLETTPVARKARMADESKKHVVLDKAGTVVLRCPADKGLRKDHPWYKPGADLYEVVAWFSKRNQKVTFELSDKHVTRLLESGRMPTGLVLAE